MVFYRKYRPQTLQELVGQEHVKSALLSAFSSEKLAHAYLFCGPRGTGKTSTARILAKMVNCEKSDGVPCNKCGNCLAITDGSHLDLIEIDAASNRGIEDIRTLRENIKLAPSKAKKKVYIIDEVHMLTNEAFNALLKTLEEPPSHVLFILATTDPQKIPETILSRVQRLDFKLASIDQVVTDLKRVAKSEKVEMDDEVLTLIAKAAQGSFRDGEKILDQLISSGAKVSKTDVENLLSGAPSENILKILQSVKEKNTKQVILDLQIALSTGATVKSINNDLLEMIRYLILIKLSLGVELVISEMGGDDYQSLVTLSEGFEMNDLINLSGLLQDSFEKLKYVTIQALPLEVALVKGSMGSSVLSSQSSESSLPVVSQSVPIELKSVTDKPVTEEPESENRPPKTDNQISADLQMIQDRWSYILETARSFNYSLEALLRSVKIGSVEEKVVVIEVPYSFHQRMIDAPKSRDLLESILSDILGRSIRVSTVLAVRPVKREDIANVEIAPDDELVRLASEIFSTETVN